MRHAGDRLIRVDKPVALTPKLKRLIETGTAIQLNPGSRDDAVYQHVVLCQVGMPHKRTDALEFERINGSVSLLLTAGKLRIRGNWVQQPLPYGPKARLIMIHITNYAKRHKTPYVEVGRSTREFLEQIGVDDQGSEYRSVKAQLQALAVCRMQLADEWEGRTSQLDAQPIKRFDALIAPDPDQQTLWPQYVELTQDYYESIRRPGGAVPLDERAIGALRGSALELDIYTWLTHRLWRIRDPKGVLVKWEDLKSQFGEEYDKLFHFKADFKIALESVYRVYPDAKVEPGPDGLLLRESRPPIPRKAIR